MREIIEPTTDLSDKISQVQQAFMDLVDRHVALDTSGATASELVVVEEEFYISESPIRLFAESAVFKKWSQNRVPTGTEAVERKVIFTHSSAKNATNAVLGAVAVTKENREDGVPIGTRVSSSLEPKLVQVVSALTTLETNGLLYPIADHPLYDTDQARVIQIGQ